MECVVGEKVHILKVDLSLYAPLLDSVCNGVVRPSLGQD